MSDDFDELYPDDGDEFGAPAAATKAKNPVAEQRKHIKELEAKLKDYEEKVPALEKFKEEYDLEQREQSIKQVFKELEVPERAVKFYKLENPEGEVTKEAVAKWAVENEFATEDQFTDATPTDKGFVPTTHGEGHIPGAKMYTRKEFEALLSSGETKDQLAANKAIEEGRVNLDIE